MARWSRFIVFAAVLTAAAVIGAQAPSFADTAPPTTPAEETLRANVQTLLNGLEGVVTLVQGNSKLAPAYKLSPTNSVAAIESAKQQVAQLNSTELDALQNALATDPSWQQIPAQLSSSVAAFAGSARKSALTPSTKDLAGTFTSSCDSAGDPAAEFTATEIANEAQAAAQTAMLAAPGVFPIFPGIDLPTGVKIALAVVWGVLNATYLALAQTLAVSTDCVATKFSNLQSSTFPTGTNRDSSEISVQSVITAATATANEIAGVQTTVATIRTQSDTLDTATTNLNTTETDINTRVAEVKADVQTLQANVAVLKNTLVNDLNKANTAITNLSNLQALQLKMEIEHNLTNVTNGSAPIGDFELPARLGGYLELVQTIVTNDVNTELALGHGPARSTTDLATANNLFAGGQFKAAYKAYAQAYKDVR